jgi:hypothetical protein
MPPLAGQGGPGGRVNRRERRCEGHGSPGVVPEQDPPLRPG